LRQSQWQLSLLAVPAIALSFRKAIVAQQLEDSQAANEMNAPQA